MISFGIVMVIAGELMATAALSTDTRPLPPRRRAAHILAKIIMATGALTLVFGTWIKIVNPVRL